MPVKRSAPSPFLAGAASPVGTPGQDNTGQMFTAALLEAARSDCPCNTCAILRQMADRLRETLMPAAKGG